MNAKTIIINALDASDGEPTHVRSIPRKIQPVDIIAAANALGVNATPNGRAKTSTGYASSFRLTCNGWIVGFTGRNLRPARKPGQGPHVDHYLAGFEVGGIMTAAESAGHAAFAENEEVGCGRDYLMRASGFAPGPQLDEWVSGWELAAG